MTAGSYELLEVVGVGGMGTVYRARHLNSGRIVAIKLLAEASNADPTQRRRFEQEYRAARRLSHPYLVEPLDFGVEEGRPYLVMEFIDGPSLGQQVRAEGPLLPEQAVALIVQVASALQLAHEHRLIHRDVKPDNILLTRSGEARLTDLGLVKDLDSDTLLTRPKAWLGTLSYMAPEQFEEAHAADARSDVYALAATLYFALTGASPFPGQGGLTILRKKLANEFPPPRRLVPSLDLELDDVVSRALHYNPLHRPQSCRAFAEQLTDALAVAARRPTATPDDNRRDAIRHPSSLAVLCSVAGDNDSWGAELQDVSRTGLCLQLSRHVEPGSTLRVEASGSEGGVPRAWVTKVRWIRRAAERWRLGCQFEQALAPDDLDALIGSTARTLPLSSRTPPEPGPG